MWHLKILSFSNEKKNINSAPKTPFWHQTQSKKHLLEKYQNVAFEDATFWLGLLSVL